MNSPIEFIRSMPQLYKPCSKQLAAKEYDAIIDKRFSDKEKMKKRWDERVATPPPTGAGEL